MSNIKKKLNEVKETISNQDEATKVLSIIMEIVEGYEDKLLELEKRQSMLEEKTSEIFDVLSDMEEELISVMGDELEGECPYCGETIPFKIPENDEDEIECPRCHNMIEFEMLFDDSKDDECDECDDCDDCNCSSLSDLDDEKEKHCKHRKNEDDK